MTHDMTPMEAALVNLASLANQLDDPMVEGMTMVMIRLKGQTTRVQRHFVNIVSEAVQLIEDVRRDVRTGV